MPTIGAYGIKMVKNVVKTQSFFLSQLSTKKDEKSIFGLHCRTKERII